eukprot:100450_1
MQSLASDEIICGILSPTMILDKNDNIDRDEYIIPTFGIYTTANILFIISTSGEEKVVALTGDREDKMVLILLVHDENTDELIKDELIYDDIIKDEIMNDMSLNSLLSNERGREYDDGEELTKGRAYYVKENQLYVLTVERLGDNKEGLVFIGLNIESN